MKSIIIILILFSLLLISCENDVVGSNEHTEIPNLSFKIDTTFLNSASKVMTARGTVTFTGGGSVSSPWFVEAQFYTDESLNTKLGGSSTQIGVPLNRNQSTFWAINFSSSNVDITDFPDFGVGDLRGIYK